MSRGRTDEEWRRIKLTSLSAQTDTKFVNKPSRDEAEKQIQPSVIFFCFINSSAVGSTTHRPSSLSLPWHFFPQRLLLISRCLSNGMCTQKNMNTLFTQSALLHVLWKVLSCSPLENAFSLDHLESCGERNNRQQLC